MQQIPGIGPINALAILAEAGDLRRFGHHRQFLKFCGLDLATHQPGQFRGRTKLSKHGNARLRRTLWMAAQVAIRQRENGFRQKFERYTAADRQDPDLRRKAFTAISRPPTFEVIRRSRRYLRHRSEIRHEDRPTRTPTRRAGGALDRH